jgi:hypothetical protein
MKHRYAWAPVALIFAASPIMVMARPIDRPALLPADTVLRVRLDDTLGSDRSRPGDRFTATVQDPALPAGGLLIGSLLGSNVVGGLLGAGAGYLLGNKHKKAENRDVVLRDGTELGVRLDQRVVLAGS